MFHEVDHEKISDVPGAIPRELQILAMLKARLKAGGAAKYMPDFPILKPKVNRVQMRLILGTHHPQGVEVFRTVQKKAETNQIETRRKIAHNEDHQLSIFSDEDLTQMELDGRGVGGKRSLSQALAECRKIVFRHHKAVKFDSLAAQIMEVAAVRTTDVKDILVTLKSEGFLNFDLVGKAKKPSDDTLISRSGK